MPEHDMTISSVTPEDPPTDLWTLLREFHEWLRDTVDDRHVPAEGLQVDERSLSNNPEGWAWVAQIDGDPAGCVLLLGLTDDLAEFRRLWVRPAHRGHGIGRVLTQRVMEQARVEGYGTLGLTTPPQSTTAQALYESLGFERTPPYPETLLDEEHHEDAIFMQFDLVDLSDHPTGVDRDDEVASQGGRR